MSDQILRLKCTKFNFGWGSALDPAAGLYRAPRDPLAELRGPTSKGRGREAKGKGRKAMERGGDETPPLHAPPIHISGYAPEIQRFDRRGHRSCFRGYLTFWIGVSHRTKIA